MIVLCVILALLVLLLWTKVGIYLKREEGVLILKVRFGVFSLQILPKKKAKGETPQDAKKKPRKEAAEKKGKKQRPKPHFTVSDYLELAKLAFEALGQFRRALVIDVFHLRFVSGFDDPYNTAMSCAYANTVLGILSPPAHAAFRVKDSRVEIIPDFERDKPDISGKLVMSIRVGRILLIALRLWLEYRRFMKRRKAETAENKSAPENSAAD